MVARWLGWLSLGLLLGACSDDEPAPPAAPGGGGAAGGEPLVCAADEWQHEDGSCRPSPFSGCAPGSYLLDGSCTSPGVPAELCGEGFASDGDGGCVAIAPDAPCGDGRMAALGETTCRPVADCGQGTWGAIVTDGDTQFVDASYGGGGNDGSQNAPWTTIQQGIQMALDGAVVAVAAGTYSENLDINGKAVRVWGRCPDLVEVVGSANPAILFRGAADGAELRGLSVSNAAIAVVIASTQNVILDEIWIHDVGFRGVELDTTAGPASATLRHSLVERASDVAVLSFGGQVVLQGTEVRDTRPASDGRFGRALAVQVDPDSGLAGSGVVDGTILRNNRDAAIWTSGCSLSVENSWIVDTQPRDADDAAGVGIGSTASDGSKSTVDVRSSVIERQHQIGAYALSGDITLDGVVVRDIAPQLSDGEFGRGVSLETVMAGMRASLTITRSLVENTRQLGICMSGGDLQVDKVLVRGVGAQQSNNQYGRAIAIQDDPGSGERGSGAITDSDVRQYAETGVFNVTSDLTLDNLVVSEPTMLTDSIFGDGILLWGDGGSASATLRMVHVDASARAGVAAFGGDITLERSWLECNPIDLNGDDVVGRPFSFTNGGDNLCGCGGIATDCKLQSAELQPPPLY